MNYALTPKPSLSDSECLVLGIYSDAELPQAAAEINEKNDNIVTRLAKKISEAGDMVWQTDINEHSLLIIQCGKKEEFTPALLQKRVAEVTEALIKQRIVSATLCLPQLTQEKAEWQLEQMIVQIDNLRYQLLDFKKKSAKPHVLESIHFYLPTATEKSLENAQCIASGLS